MQRVVRSSVPFMSIVGDHCGQTKNPAYFRKQGLKISVNIVFYTCLPFPRWVHLADRARSSRREWQNILRATIEPAYSARATIIVGAPDVVMFMQVFIKCATVLSLCPTHVNRFF